MGLLSGPGEMRAPEVLERFLLASVFPTWVNVFDKQKSLMLCKTDECFLIYGRKLLMFKSFFFNDKKAYFKKPISIQVWSSATIVP